MSRSDALLCPHCLGSLSHGQEHVWASSPCPENPQHQPTHDSCIAKTHSIVDPDGVMAVDV